MRRRLIIQGRVQGVGYRWWTVGTVKDLATLRGLPITGWVRNRRDGTVEILAEGSATALDALANACRGGPPAAMVGDIAIEDDDGDEVLQGFTQRPTV